MKKAILLLLLLQLSLQAFPQSVVRNLDIRVSLKQNGDAHVREVWDIDIGDDVKTEWYVAHYNLGDREILRLKGSDNGRPMTTVDGEWDVDANLEEKAGKCGLRTKEGGYEICWGVPTKGSHVYRVDYDITSLVLSYPDKDGFGYWFADLNANDPIMAFRITITAPKSLSAANCGIWGFGYEGQAKAVKGTAIASASGRIDRVGLLMSFNKGVLFPTLKGSGTFDDLKEKAFEGSDFGGGSEGEPMPRFVWIILAAIVGGAAAVFGAIGVKRRKARRIPYYKEVDSSWSMVKAAKVLDEYGWLSTENLMGAMLLRLIAEKKIAVVDTDQRDRKGRTKKALKIVVEDVGIPTEKKGTDDYVCHYLLYIMSRAADKDGILTTSRFKTWAEKNTEELEDLQKNLDVDKCKENLSPEDKQHVLGLRNYLIDFNKVCDGRVSDVSTWDAMLVYSYLFGITKQLTKDIRAICPAYLQASAFGREIDDLYLDNSHFLYYLSSAISPQSVDSASSTSYGGGGGFSGGGGGGGR